MTPKQKSEELVNKFKKHSYTNMFSFREESNLHNAKQCALIAVDEMIVQNGELYLNQLGEKTLQFYIKKNHFLFEVKKEIEKL